MYLEALILRLQPDFLRYGARIPFHERGIYLKNLITVQTYDLGLLRFLTLRRQIEFIIAPNVNFL